jgi:midasin
MFAIRTPSGAFPVCFHVFPYRIQLRIVSILSAFLRKAYSKRGPLAFVLEAQSVESVDAQHLHYMLLAYYRVLQANRALPNTLLWNPLPLVRLIRTPHPDNGVRFLAIRCYALQTGTGEQERVNMEKQIIGEVSQVDCSITYGVGLDGTTSYMDGWIFPLLEAKRISDARNSIAESGSDYYSVEDGDSVEPIPVDALR